MKPWSLFAVTQPGLESFLEEELQELNIKIEHIENGGVAFFGHMNTIFKVNCFSRIASRLIIRYKTFQAKRFSELENKLKIIDWEPFVRNKKSICIRANSYRSILYHENAIIERVQRDLKKKYPTINFVSTLQNSAIQQLIIVNNIENNFTVNIDTTGVHLHKRGYQEYRGKAPLRSTIAAAMIRTIPKYEPLRDPFCGSGTFLFEKSLRDYPVSLHAYRDFSFQYWTIFQEDYWNKFLLSLEKHEDTGQYYFSDIDEREMKCIRNNWLHFGKRGTVKFETSDYLSSVPTPHHFIANLPYGKRSNLNQKIFSKIRKDWKQEIYLSMTILLPTDQIETLCIPHKVILKTKNGAIPIRCIQLQ